MTSFIATVRNFAHVPVQKRTLYVIDVDETVLYFHEISRLFWDDGRPREEVMEDFRRIVRSCEPVPTDPLFLSMFLERIVLEESCVLFVTARDYELTEITRAQLSKVGVNVPFSLVCTSGGPKGKITKWLWKHKYSHCNHVVFVDDLLTNIEDVQREIPDASVFMFSRH